MRLLSFLFPTAPTSGNAPPPPTRAGTLPGRILWNTLGTLLILLAAIGVVLPGLPTTPFVLLACSCYMRGSERMSRRLLQHRIFGPLIRDWRAGLGIPVRGKVLAMLMMVGFAGYALGPGMPAHYFTPRIILTLTVIWGSIVILRMPTRKAN